MKFADSLTYNHHVYYEINCFNKRERVERSVITNFPPRGWHLNSRYGDFKEFYLFTDYGDILVSRAFGFDSYQEEYLDIARKLAIKELILYQDIGYEEGYYFYLNEAVSITEIVIRSAGEYSYEFDYMDVWFIAQIDVVWRKCDLQYFHRLRGDDFLGFTWWEWYDPDEDEPYFEFVKSTNLAFYE
jgi:hypothetical protein